MRSSTEACRSLCRSSSRDERRRCCVVVVVVVAVPGAAVSLALAW